MACNPQNMMLQHIMMSTQQVMPNKSLLPGSLRMPATLDHTRISVSFV